eukprot:TRINITY_DN7329_c0_g1_i1.p2 TRINITY_DN7329_c0_g1~~TRINITY_DN7329_c0_g1_i1.p2  ORF type:complete len:244 (-),score=88.07 TRINITY_DN7329_c0_g1_i1:835-1566(-)
MEQSQSDLEGFSSNLSSNKRNENEMKGNEDASGEIVISKRLAKKLKRKEAKLDEKGIKALNEKYTNKKNRIKCAFWLPTKNRTCAFPPVSESQYCDQHRSEVNGRKRIPCTLDDRHCVYEDELEKHLKKCNTLRDSNRITSQLFYKKDINAGSGDEGEEEIEPIESKAEVKEENNEEKVVKGDIPVTSKAKKEQKQSILYDLSDEELKSLIDRVEKAYEEHVEGKIPIDIRSSSVTESLPSFI